MGGGGATEQTYPLSTLKVYSAPHISSSVVHRWRVQREGGDMSVRCCHSPFLEVNGGSAVSDPNPQ